jgi:hypothetical protein
MFVHDAFLKMGEILLASYDHAQCEIMHKIVGPVSAPAKPCC